MYIFNTNNNIYWLYLPCFKKLQRKLKCPDRVLSILDTLNPGYAHVSFQKPSFWAWRPIHAGVYGPISCPLTGIQLMTWWTCPPGKLWQGESWSILFTDASLCLKQGLAVVNNCSVNEWRDELMNHPTHVTHPIPVDMSMASNFSPAQTAAVRILGHGPHVHFGGAVTLGAPKARKSFLQYDFIHENREPRKCKQVTTHIRGWFEFLFLHWLSSDLHSLTPDPCLYTLGGWL